MSPFPLPELEDELELELEDELELDEELEDDDELELEEEELDELLEELLLLPPP